MNGLMFFCVAIGSTLCFIAETQSAVVTPSVLGQSKACANHYCQNGGLCVPYTVDDFYTCTCQPGSTGPFCENALVGPDCRPTLQDRDRIHVVIVRTFGEAEGTRIREAFRLCAENNQGNPQASGACIKGSFTEAKMMAMTQAIKDSGITWECEKETEEGEEGLGDLLLALLGRFPADWWSEASDSSITIAYKNLGLISELTDVAPPTTAKILYRGNNVLDQNIGKTNTPTQVRYQPLQITWANMLPSHFYSIIMIDPDMPTRTTPVAQKTQVLHWLMVNIPGDGIGGRQLAPYIGSGPPPGTGIHRYSFFVFDEGTTPKDYTNVNPFDLVDITRRVNWNFVEAGKPWTLRGFQQWANMGLPVAGNVYQAQWDTWVDQLWRTFNTYYE